MKETILFLRCRWMRGLRSIIFGLVMAVLMGTAFGWPRDIPNSEEFLKGDAAYWAKDYAKGIRCFTEVIEVNPEDKDAWAGRGYCYQAKGLFTKAIADYTASLKLGPAQWFVLYSRGCAYRSKGRYAETISDFKGAIEVGPVSQSGTVTVYNELAWLWATCPMAKFRDGAEAVKAARAAWEASMERSANVKDTLAAAYAEAGDFASAVKWEKEFLATPGLVKKEAEEARERLGFYERGRAWRDGT